jgi:hypothetical protein
MTVYYGALLYPLGGTGAADLLAHCMNYWCDQGLHQQCLWLVDKQLRVQKDVRVEQDELQ